MAYIHDLKWFQASKNKLPYFLSQTWTFIYSLISLLPHEFAPLFLSRHNFQWKLKAHNSFYCYLIALKALTGIERKDLLANIIIICIAALGAIIAWQLKRPVSGQDVSNPEVYVGVNLLDFTRSVTNSNSDSNSIKIFQKIALPFVKTQFPTTYSPCLRQTLSLSESFPHLPQAEQLLTPSPRHNNSLSVYLSLYSMC